MKLIDATIVRNRALNGVGYYEMSLACDGFGTVQPGQFLNIELPGKYLRRPFGICDVSEGSVTVVYKVVGEGTKLMSAMVPGETLNLMLPLGNGFDVTACAGFTPVLLSGGAGLAPLFPLCKALISAGNAVKVLLGFNCAADAFYIDEYKALGADVTVYTADGSLGEKGFPLGGLSGITNPYAFVCGPPAMLEAFKATGVPGQLSYEARMGCGFGACMGCAMKTSEGPKRICVDGPVFKREILC